MQEPLFPNAHAVLEEAESRHNPIWPFVVEAIDLAHIAYDRVEELTSPLIPGIPGKVRSRNDINDYCWRFFNSIADPLVEDGIIQSIEQTNGGSGVIVLPDGLHVRMKKSDSQGRTSNYPTPSVQEKSFKAVRQCLFRDATELDNYIMDGNGIDAAFEVGEAMGEYRQVFLKFAYTHTSPQLTLDQPNTERLRSISPAAEELASAARHRLSA